MHVKVKEIREVAWVGDEYLAGTPRGVVLSFHGLGHTGDKRAPGTEDLGWAAAGGLVVFPYYGPWSWLNRPARAFVDELVDGVYEAFGLADDAPLICTGGSMGGCGSLLYTRYARRGVAGCVANAPACDLTFHYDERPDLPKTMRHAFRDHPEGLSAALIENSPLSQVARMPDVPYLLLHGGQDALLSKERHSDLFVAAMRQAGRSVEYIELPKMGHCGPLPVAAIARIIDFVAALLPGGRDRGRRGRLCGRPPLPPNRTGGFPASGSPVSGSPGSGWTQGAMGRQ